MSETSTIVTGLGNVAELRQYTLRDGRFADLVAVFEEHFVTGQEADGITVGGLFADEAAPDRFVWMRGFPGLQERTASLQAFYGGPVWAEHRDRANATMVDSDDVLLLQPGSRTPGTPSGSRAVLGIWAPGTEVDEDVADLLGPALGVPVVTWRPHPGPNGFPALPVRDDQAVVWLAAFPGADQRQAALTRLHADEAWQALDRRLGPAVTYEELLLRPTARSRHALS